MCDRIGMLAYFGAASVTCTVVVIDWMVAIISDGSDPSGSTVPGLCVYADVHDLAKLREGTGISQAVLPHKHLNVDEKVAVDKSCRDAKIKCVRLAVSVDEGQRSVNGK